MPMVQTFVCDGFFDLMFTLHRQCFHLSFTVLSRKKIEMTCFIVLFQKRTRNPFGHFETSVYRLVGKVFVTIYAKILCLIELLI